MNETFMKERPVGLLVFQMAIPMVLSMLVSSLYNIIDSYFVAKISEEAMTALSLVFPLQNIINALAIGFGIGTNAAISFYLGAGKDDEAARSATMGLVYNGIHGILLGALCAAIVPCFISFYTSDAITAAYSVSYGRIVFAFSLFNCAQMTFEKIYQAHGRMKTAMACVLTGSIINIILDPLMIFGIGPFPAMGLEGAAIATGIGQSLPLVIYIILTIARPLRANPGLKNISFDGKTAKRLYAVGIPAALNLAFPSVMISALNAVLAAFGQVYVLVLGVYYKLQNFIYLTANGIVQGIRPLLGYNYGAKEYKRVRQIYKTALLFAAVIMAVGTALCLAVPGRIFSLFTENPDTVKEGAKALRIICAGFIVSSVSVVTCGSLEGLGKGTASTVITILRYIAVIIPFAFILSRFMGASGVWAAFPATEVICAAISVILYRRKIRM